jgi:hypothetical protein
MSRYFSAHNKKLFSSTYHQNAQQLIIFSSRVNFRTIAVFLNCAKDTAPGDAALIIIHHYIIFFIYQNGSDYCYIYTIRNIQCVENKELISCFLVHCKIGIFQE